MRRRRSQSGSVSRAATQLLTWLQTRPSLKGIRNSEYEGGRWRGVAFECDDDGNGSCVTDATSLSARLGTSATSFLHVGSQLSSLLYFDTRSCFYHTTLTTSFELCIMLARPRLSLASTSCLAKLPCASVSIPELLRSRQYATQSSLGGNQTSSKRRQVTIASDDGRIQWNDLSTREKAARTTQQSFNLLVIIAGVIMTVSSLSCCICW